MGANFSILQRSENQFLKFDDSGIPTKNLLNLATSMEKIIDW